MNTSDSNYAWPLLKDERIVWSGRPAQGILFTSRDGLLIPFSLLWAGFAVFWEVNALQTPNPDIFPIVGAAFVLVGLYLVAGRFVADAWLRNKTYYAVTNRRVLIARLGKWGNFTALGLDRLPEIKLSPAEDGSGTLRFGPAANIWARGGFPGWTLSLDPTPQFIGIADAQHVFDQIQSAIQSFA